MKDHYAHEKSGKKYFINCAKITKTELSRTEIAISDFLIFLNFAKAAIYYFANDLLAAKGGSIVIL